MRSKSYYFLLLVLALGLLAAVGYKNLQYRFGLDVQGGVRFTYQMVPTNQDQRERLPVLREQMVGILQQRAHGPLGVAEPTVLPKGDDQIVVELPGFSNVEEAKETMGSSARIQFYAATTVDNPIDSNRAYHIDESKDAKDISVGFKPKFGNGPTIQYLDPVTKRANPEYARIIKSWGDPILEGDDLVKAEPQTQGSNYVPLLHFRTTSSKKGEPSAADRLETWSRNHTRENIAAVLDGKVLSIAALQEGAVLSDNAVIQGTFPDGYVPKLCDTLNSGALPVDLQALSSEQVDPSIGKTALNKIVAAGVVAFGVVSLFLIAYYSFPGLIAFLALSLYVLFSLAVMKLINVTFSLAGIAGFILSVGMAVDANILVFERFKEEAKNGKSLTSAIELGFKRALSAIIDSNACTLLTSIVLINLGTGPVKGFATTLAIGVVISLFTAVTVTRSLLMFFVGSGIATNPKWFALDRDWFARFVHEDKEFRIVETSKKWFAISAFTILISIPFFFVGGFRTNVEFQGGYEAVFTLKDQSITSNTLVAALEKADLKGGNAQIATAGNDRIAYITLPQLPQLKGTDQQNVATIAQAVSLSPSDSRGFTKIGGTVSNETKQNAILGVLASSGLIIIYLGLRFGTGFGGFKAGLRFGVSAIGALIHDILVVVGTAAIVGKIFGWEVSALFLTALLTIIGFSVHDTIVVFDRIRENLHKPRPGETFAHLTNRSIAQSFARSVNTSATVIVTLGILVFFGTTTPDLKFFVTSMLIGIVSGTYSSIYNASPILYLWDKAIAKRNGEGASLVGMANAERSRNHVITTSATAPTAGTATGSDGRTYGQVRRRANSPRKGIELDD